MPAEEATLTTLPPLRARRWGRAALMVWYGPVRLTPRTRCHSRGSVSSKRATPPTPAAFTSTSRPPKRSTARAIPASTEARSATSQRPPSAVPPAARIASTVWATPVSFTSTAHTRAPSAAKAFAVAWPRPDAAPVIHAVRSLKRWVDIAGSPRHVRHPSREGPMAAITEGKAAPAFTLKDAAGKDVALEDFAGKDVILYFYPKDDTPGCTKEACGFRDSWKDVQKRNAVVLGVSGDTGASHQKFAAKYKLPFPLLSDPDRKVMAKYGAYGEKVMYGKK